MQCIVLFAITAVGVFIWTADKGATGKFDHSNSKAKQADRIEVVKNAVASRQSRIPSATYINKLHNRQSPTRPEKMNRNDVQGNNNLKNKPGKPLPRETKTWKPDFDLSSINTRSSRNKTPPAKKPAPATGKAEKPSGIRSRSNSSSRSPSVERKKEKQLSDPFRQIINERVKLQHNRDSPFNATPRPNTGLNMRSFKPQLEDIKSSYMLLNTKTHQDHTRNADRAKKYTAAIDKPKPIDEEYRKQLLREAKNKFQSKGFFANSKYDKIEGLNWISWK